MHLGKRVRHRVYGWGLFAFSESERNSSQIHKKENQVSEYQAQLNKLLRLLTTIIIS